MSIEKRESEYLSVILSGGISLGAYHAGVMAQLGRFLKAWDKLCDADPRLTRIYVDVISGASAGALTGSMLFQYIGTDYYKTKGNRTDTDAGVDFLQANFNAWCKELSFHKLLQRATDDNDKSVLSNNLVEELANNAIQNLTPKLPSNQDRLLFTCTITSVDPIHFDIKLPDAIVENETVSIVGSTRRDWVTFQMSSNEKVPIRMSSGIGKYSNLACSANDCVFMELASTPADGSQDDISKQLWHRLRYFALASGAFPFAWSPISISRNLFFYPPATKGSEERLKEAVFEYMDGGIINNMPLDRAAKVIRDYGIWTEAAHGILDRTYLLIDVSPQVVPEPKVENKGEFHSHRNRERSLFYELGPMGQAIREQGYYLDLLNAQHINDQLDLREKYLWPLLKDSVTSQDSEQLRTNTDRAREELNSLVSKKYHANSEEIEHVAKLLKSQYLSRHADFIDQVSVEKQELLLLSMIIADFVSDLAGKHHLSVVRVQPSRTLKSAFFGDFGGFVQESFMRDDFWHGMQCASKSLKNWLLRIAPDAETSSLFCDFEEFQQAVSLGKVSQDEIESYYCDDKIHPVEWSDAERASQSRFLSDLSGRLDKITVGLFSKLVRCGEFLSSFQSKILVVGIIVLGGLLMCWKSVLCIVAGSVLLLVGGAMIPLVVVCQALWPKLVKLVPTIKDR